VKEVVLFMGHLYSSIRVIAAVLLVLGGVNWGLVGFFHFDLVAAIFGGDAAFSRIVYSLVGLSAVYLAFVYLPEEIRRASRSPQPITKGHL
jgi:uncharacterized membrane protein YuzA (DUF378 family)